MRSNVVIVGAKNIRSCKMARSGSAEDKERGKVTKAGKGSDDHLDGRRKQYVELGIVKSATKGAKRNGV
jgi:hypothetical protein